LSFRELFLEVATWSTKSSHFLLLVLLKIIIEFSHVYESKLNSTLFKSYIMYITIGGDQCFFFGLGNVGEMATTSYGYEGKMAIACV
jgi:hypothetical protein